MIRALDTLASRAILLSLIGITLVHFLSLWTYERALDRELRLVQDVRLAEKLLSIRRSVMLVPRLQRESLAHELSGGPIEAHWSDNRGAAPGGPGAARFEGLSRQVALLAPELGASDIVIGSNTDDDNHLAMVSLRLPDTSWVNVSLFATGRPQASPHSAVLSTSLMALGVVLLSVLIARWLTRPIREVSDAVRTITTDGAPKALDVAGPVEVRDLAKAFNDMQHRIAEQISRRTLSLAAVSHDLRTPLTRLKLRSEDMTDPDLKRAVASDIEEMEQMIDATLSYLRGDETREARRPIDLTAMLETIVDNARDAGVAVSLDAPEHFIIDGRLVGLRRALTNLLSNAIRFASGVNVIARRDSDEVRVTVNDDGPGIPVDQLEAVLEPFVRLDHSRNRETGGVGLGLTIAKSHIEADGGRLELSNRPGGGLSAAVVLPLRRA